MIDHISITSQHMYGGSSENSLPYISPDFTHIENPPRMGEVRCVSQKFEAWNGTGWQSFGGSYASIGMNGVAEKALTWAIDKMIEEQRLSTLATNNPTIADAVSAVKTAQEQLNVVLALTKVNE